MDNVKKNKLLIVTDDQFRDIRKSYNVTKESIDRDVTTLIEWVNFQPHLPEKELDRDWVERVFITSKCSVERSKKCLDMNLSSRSLFPDFFLKRFPESVLERSKSFVSITPLPKLSKDLTRVVIVTFLENGADSFDAIEHLRMFYMVLEYLQHNDYMMGYRFIFNLKHVTLEHYLKMYPTVLKKAVACTRNVVGARLAGYHVVYPPNIVDKLVTLGKAMFSQKLQGRVNIHHTFEDLHEQISREILPVDYGGDEKSLDLLADDWKNLITSDKFADWNERMNNLRSDESKRIGEKPFDDTFGISGSFRQLDFE